MTTSTAPEASPTITREAIERSPMTWFAKLTIEFLSRQPQGAVVLSSTVGGSFGIIAARVAEVSDELRRHAILQRKIVDGSKAIDLDQHHLCLVPAVWRAYQPKDKRK